MPLEPGSSAAPFDEHVEARRQALWYASLAMVGAVLGLVLVRHAREPRYWEWTQVAAIDVVFVTLILSVRSPSRVVKIAGYQLLNISFLVADWVTSAIGAASAVPVAFGAFKIAVMIAVFVGPLDLAIGVPAIVAFTLAPIVEWLSWPQEWRSLVTRGEPLQSVVYGLIGLVIFANRVRNARIDRKLNQARAEAQAAQQVARMALAVRDHANTPLQTLHIGLSQSQQQILPGHFEKMMRAVERLTELNRLLEPYSGTIEWVPEDPSIEPRALLGSRGNAK
jgi:hypothetical protein